MITDYFTLAFRNLKKRKLRSWLTIIGIIISIATIFMLVSISLGLQTAVEEQFQQLGKDKFFIQPRGTIAGPGTEAAVMLTEADIDEIKKVGGVKEVTYFVITSGKIEYGREIRFYTVVGIPTETGNVFLETGIYKIDEGRFLRDGDSGVVSLGNHYKYKNIFSRPVEVGDKVSVNNKEFEVKAILEPIGNPVDDKSVVMPIEDFRELFNITSRIDQVMVQVNPNEDIIQIADRVEKKLRKSRGLTEDTQDFSILTPEEILESFKSILNIITAFLAGVAAISLVVGGIGIANTMYTSVLERTKEI